MSDSEDIQVKTIKKPKKAITEKQKLARQANLAKGRETRKQNIEAKKRKSKNVEYQLDSSDDESDDEVDMDSLILSKKPKKKHESKRERVQYDDDADFRGMRKELQDIRAAMYEMNKKQRRKRTPKESGTKIVVLPNNNAPAHKEASQPYDNSIRQLLAAINKK